MPDLVDLHLHSCYSDGVLTPSELVSEAAELGLRAIALADHDNIDGVGEAMATGDRLGVEVVSGVELSVVWQELNDVHLLGYGFDHTDMKLGKALAEFREFRAGRSRQVLERVNEKLSGEGKQPLDYAAVAARAGGTIGRPHLGQALLAAGYVRSMEDAFVRYLVPCNVDKRYFPINEAIDLVRDAGGCTVLAHPPFIDIDDEELPGLLDVLIPLGLDGMEAYNAGTTNDGIDRYITLARQKGLIVTGGSDFHQPETGGVKMGLGRGNLKIPYRCVEEVREKTARYKQ
jgi:predicted metal-dependent phosphoesterase TrpH